LKSKIAILSAAVLALGIAGATTASAATPPATGSVSCGVSGTAALKPSLQPTGSTSTKPVTVKANKGPLSGCTVAVTGGKYPISGGSVSLVTHIVPGTSPTVDCGSVAGGADGIVKPVLKVQLTGINPKSGKPSTVATIKVTNVAIAPAGVGFGITGDIAQNKANTANFGGEHFSAQINVDNFTDFVGCLTPGGTPVSHIDFSAAGASTMSIAP
jgi:hypothetical protein